MAETKHKWNDFALNWTRGRELLLDLRVTRTPNGGTAVPQDLSGGIIRLTGKLSLSDSDSQALFRLSSAASQGIEIRSAGEGTAVATIPAQVTRNLSRDATRIYVDCVWIDADGKPYSFQKGSITFYANAETLS